VPRLTGALFAALGVAMVALSRQWAESQVRHMPRWYVGIMGPAATLRVMQVLLIIGGLLVVALGVGTLTGRFTFRFLGGG
jgi:hypothetical protein